MKPIARNYEPIIDAPTRLVSPLDLIESAVAVQRPVNDNHGPNGSAVSLLQRRRKRRARRMARYS